MNYYSQRIERLRSVMHDLAVDVLYIRNISNLRWLTGFEQVFDSEAAHLLLVGNQNEIIHTDSRYVAAMEQAAVEIALPVDASKNGFVDFLILTIKDQLITQANNTSDEYLKQSLTIGVEDSIMVREWIELNEKVNALSAELDYPLKLKTTTNVCERLREIKSPDELHAMKSAQAITDAGFAHIIQFMKCGMTELEVQRELDAFMFEAGADDLAFDTIVATGAHGASPHAQPGNRILQPGDAVVMDFGAKKHGYCSDMTRTVFMGKPSEELMQAWQALRAANETCEAMIACGVPACDVHHKAEEILADHGFANCMGHSLGHGVGLDIHELPTLSPSNQRTLEIGNVVTVEPGIYLDGKFGMRLEDFGVVSENGFEVFTQSSHDMVIIENC